MINCEACPQVGSPAPDGIHDSEQVRWAYDNSGSPGPETSSSLTQARDGGRIIGLQGYTILGVPHDHHGQSFKNPDSVHGLPSRGIGLGHSRPVSHSTAHWTNLIKRGTPGLRSPDVVSCSGLTRWYFGVIQLLPRPVRGQTETVERVLGSSRSVCVVIHIHL